MKSGARYSCDQGVQDDHRWSGLAHSNVRTSKPRSPGDIANGHRADFERECKRTNKFLAELLKTTSESMGAREKAPLLEGKLSMLTQPRRRRLVDAFSLALPQVATRESAGSVAQSRNGTDLPARLGFS